MNSLVVVENVKRWPFELEDVEVVPAREYLTDGRYSDLKRTTVFNVCRDYGYQSVGYYVSLLAAARGHRPLPSVDTIQSLLLSPVVRIASEELDTLIQRSLQPLKSDDFELSIYFGRNVAKRYDRLSGALFNQFPAPFLRARFVRENGRWRIQSVRPIATSQIPDIHRDFVLDRAREYFARPTHHRTRKQEYRYDMAILWTETDAFAPSNDKAIRKFIRAAWASGIRAEVIGRDDAAHIGEYDALFIRETTAVNHHTYRLARRAEAAGLMVIDDPQSIVRCTNKVYQAELFQRHGIPAPRTLVLHEGNVDEAAASVGFPAVLKRPDGSFSQGVVRVESAEELNERLPELFRQSELVILQAFTPSSFDWRIGVLGGAAVWAARYHMARGHWQIIRDETVQAGSAEGATRRYGRVEALPLHVVPRPILELGVKAASLIGDGIYGVDIKEIDGKPVVMEVNDNPNVDAGHEDGVIKDELYDTVMRYFRQRLDARGPGPSV